MKIIQSFASHLGAKFEVNPEFVIENNQMYYLLNPALLKLAKRDFFTAGLYLGKARNNEFFPSFNLLNILVDTAANKVILNHKAAWLFICGRDVFHKGISKVAGSKQKDSLTLVLNEFDECLGFGKITSNLDQAKGKMAIKNILDVGDFLRREKR